MSPAFSANRRPSRFSRTKILPQIISRSSLEGKTEPDRLRLWVAGCSTGEEAYSIAIVLAEYLGDRVGKVPVQIFATDLSESSIEHARAGVYCRDHPRRGPSGTAVPLLRKVQRELPGDAVHPRYVHLRASGPDPGPAIFPHRSDQLPQCPDLPGAASSEEDSCRVPLRAEGQWFPLAGKIGDSERIPGLVHPVEKKGKFYRKRAAANVPHFRAAAGYDRAEQPSKLAKTAAPPLVDLQKEADRIVWSRYAHAGVIVDENLQILHFRGDTSPYMAPAAGAASLHLLKMVRGDLLVDLRAAFHKSKKGNTPVREEGIRMTSNGRMREVTLEVVPLSALDNAERHFLILV